MLLYYMDVSELDITRKRNLRGERINKSNRYYHLKDKRLSIGVELLLNHALAITGIDDPLFDMDDNGKPYLKNYTDFHFNLSHSENYVACAVSDSPVGVDIEYINDIDLNVARQFFFGSEYEYIMNNNNHNKSFFKLWVLKESYMKMTGLGFRLALDEFSVEIGDEIKLKPEDNCNLAVWCVSDGEYMLGVCSKSKISTPELINLQDLGIDQ